MKKPKETILHLGCGPKKIPGAVGVDINKNIGADVVHDLNRFPYPFKSNYFDKVIAQNIMEHLQNIPKVMEELHRICKNGANLIITTGHFSGIDSFTDPTHIHFFTSRTFDYFIPGTDLFDLQYSKAKYRKIKIQLGPKKSNFPLNLILKLVNTYPVIYEKRFAFIFPVGVISYELSIVKDK